MAGGLLVGLIFPPAFLASGVVGAGIGAGVGGLISHKEKKQIKAEVADDLPPNSSGIVALFDEQWTSQVTQALKDANNVSKHQVDKDGVEQAKDATASTTCVTTSAVPRRTKNGDPLWQTRPTTPRYLIFLPT